MVKAPSLKASSSRILYRPFCGVLTMAHMMSKRRSQLCRHIMAAPTSNLSKDPLNQYGIYLGPWFKVVHACRDSATPLQVLLPCPSMRMPCAIAWLSSFPIQHKILHVVYRMLCIHIYIYIYIDVWEFPKIRGPNENANSRARIIRTPIGTPFIFGNIQMYTYIYAWKN